MTEHSIHSTYNQPMPYIISSEDGGTCGHSHQTINCARACIDRSLSRQTQPDAGTALRVEWRDPETPKILQSPPVGTQVRAKWLNTVKCWQIQTKASASEPFRPSAILEKFRLNDVQIFADQRSVAINGTIASDSGKCDCTVSNRTFTINH